jgi:hypothetical protein
MATADDLRRLALSLPRTTEHLVRGRWKFRVKAIVYASLSEDETTMGCAFPKEERMDAVAAEPEKFAMPSVADQRFNWIHVRLAAVDRAELTELVVDAWRMVVPKFVVRAHLGDPPDLERAVRAAERHAPDHPERVGPSDGPAADRSSE